MTKIRPLKQRKVISILRKNGFREVRKAKHITFKKYLDNGQVLTTWVPNHSEISVFVIDYIIKQSGKKKEEFWP
jgi:predicted RNA binding protein YcfA (HicA-like mRNA interferase family)